jgi:exodeoxyribonuclease VII large subunit
MADVVFTVSQITEYINRKFFQDPLISAVKVVGEVTNFSMSSAGHAFFSLKDESSMISCIVYDFSEHQDKDVISDGALLTVSGRVTFYRKSGTIQLAVETAALQGVGDLFARFERTKKRLTEEGLFAAAHKKPLPLFPTHLGVVTSTSGAVLYDIINVATRRFDGIRITVYPVPVQGIDAADKVSEGIRHFNSLGNVDVIIVARGGGSFEDLFAFNEERVARAVYESDTPVVSAVGHETDYTLCDMAADLRAPTPSAAAELVVREKKALLDTLEQRKASLGSALFAVLDFNERRLSAAASSLSAYPLYIKIDRVKERIDSQLLLMQRGMDAVLKTSVMKLTQYQDRLESLNPKNVLARGYALVYSDKNRIVAASAAATGRMEIEFSDGRVAVERTDR